MGNGKTWDAGKWPLHETLRLTRPLVLFDFESTGTDASKDRAVELGFQVWKPEVGLEAEWRSPIDPGIPIPPETTKIHGISDATMKLCRECGKTPIEHPSDWCETFKRVPKFAEIAPKLARGFSNCDLAGKNVRYDIELMCHEMSIAKVDWSPVGARIVDAERIEQVAVPRTLSALYEKYVGKPENAHEALADVRMTAEILVAQLRVHDFLPRDLDQLQETLWPGHIDIAGKFRMGADGIPRFGPWGKHQDKPMAEVSKKDPTYWDFMLKAAFLPDTKAIAAAAKLGRFPERKVNAQ